MTKQERGVLHGEMGSTGIVCDVRGLIEGAAGFELACAGLAAL